MEGARTVGLDNGAMKYTLGGGRGGAENAHMAASASFNGDNRGEAGSRQEKDCRPGAGAGAGGRKGLIRAEHCVWTRGRAGDGGDRSRSSPLCTSDPISG